MRQPVSRRVYLLLPILYCALALLLAAPARAQEGEPSAESMTDPMSEAPSDTVILSLQDVLNAALEHNLDVAVRRYDPLRRDANVMVSQSAFDPTLTGRAESLRFEDAFNSQFGTPLIFGSREHNYSIRFEDPLTTGGRYSFEISGADRIQDRVFTDTVGNVFMSVDSEVRTEFKVTFDQPLLRGLGPDANKWLIVVSRNDRSVSESQFTQAVLDTLAAAETSYWDLNFAIMELKTQRSALGLAQEFLEQNRIKVRVGTLAPIEITQAEADDADREERVIVAEHQVLGAEDTLRRIMNVPYDSPWWTLSIQPEQPPRLQEVTLDMEIEVRTAESHRPDLEQARLNVQSRETEASYRVNQKRWGLDFSAGYSSKGADLDDLAGRQGTYRDAFDIMRDNDLPNWNLALTLSVPIGNREAIASYIEADHALNQARYELQRVTQLTRVEVRDAVRTVRTNIKRVHATQVNSRLQREKMEAEQKKFENGMSTSFQVLTFQNDLTEAESRQNLAIVDLNKSLVELERVKGTLLQARRMLLPDNSADGAREERPAALRQPWLQSPVKVENIATRFPDDLPQTVVLPSSFVFKGNRVVGVGGTIEIEEESTAGR